MNLLKAIQNVIEYKKLEHLRLEAFLGEMIRLMVKKYGPLVKLESYSSNPKIAKFNLLDHPILFSITVKIYSTIFNNPITETIYGDTITVKILAEAKNKIIDQDKSLNTCKMIIQNKKNFDMSDDIKIRCQSNSIFAIKEFSFEIENILTNQWEERKRLEQEMDDQINILSEYLEQFNKNIAKAN